MKFTNYAVALALCATSSVFAAAPSTAHEDVIKAIHKCATEHKDVAEFKNCASAANKDNHIDASIVEKLATDHKDKLDDISEDVIKHAIAAHKAEKDVADLKAKTELIENVRKIAEDNKAESVFHTELHKKKGDIEKHFGKDVYERMLKMKPHELDEQAEIQDLLDEEYFISEIMKCKETDQTKQTACLGKIALLAHLSQSTKDTILKLSAADVKSRAHVGSIIHKDHEEKVQAVHTALIAGIGECNKKTDLTERTNCLEKLGNDHKLSQAKIDELVKKEAKDLATADQITKHAHSIVRSKTNVYASHPWYTQPMVWIGTVLLVAVIAIFLYYYNSKKQSAEESTDL